jgi:hypothetical protein
VSVANTANNSAVRQNSAISLRPWNAGGTINSVADKSVAP